MITEEYYSAGCAVGLLQRELGFSSAILHKCLNSVQAMFFVIPSFQNKHCSSELGNGGLENWSTDIGSGDMLVLVNDDNEDVTRL